MEIEVVRFLKQNVHSLPYYILIPIGHFIDSSNILLINYNLRLTWSWLHHLYAKTWQFVIRSILQTIDRCCIPIAPVTYHFYTLHQMYTYIWKCWLKNNHIRLHEILTCGGHCGK